MRGIIIISIIKLTKKINIRRRIFYYGVYFVWYEECIYKRSSTAAVSVVAKIRFG